MELLSSHRAEHPEVASGDRQVPFKHLIKNKLWGLDTTWATRSCPHFCVVPPQLCQQELLPGERGWASLDGARAGKWNSFSFCLPTSCHSIFLLGSNSSGGALLFKGYLRLEVWLFSKNLNPALSCTVRVRADFLILLSSSRLTDFGEGRIPPPLHSVRIYTHILYPLCRGLCSWQRWLCKKTF